MSTAPDRRTRKRLATRQVISDVATRLFIERGFDNVTVDEIAQAADVGRMTVFNHFPRKEDMFFDRDEEGREAVRNALLGRDPNVTPTEALRRLARRAASEEPLYIFFSPETRGFVQTIEKSPALTARARTLLDELAQFLAEALAEAAERAVDPDAALAANLIIATWTTAFIQAHRVYRSGNDPIEAKSIFLALIDRGTDGVEAAMAGTSYGRDIVGARD